MKHQKPSEASEYLNQTLKIERVKLGEIINGNRSGKACFHAVNLRWRHQKPSEATEYLNQTLKIERVKLGEIINEII